MTTDLNDSDKQASVCSDIRSLCCELISLDRKGVWFVSLGLFNTDSDSDGVVYPQLRNTSVPVVSLKVIYSSSTVQAFSFIWNSQICEIC